MKMNIKTMAIAAMAVIGMTACSKEEIGGNGPDNGETGSVSIALSQNLGTRAVVAPADGDVAVTLTTGYVIFANSVDVVNKVVQIVPGAYPASPSADDVAAKTAGTKVWLGELTATGGAEIKNVPAASTQVWIAGNLPTGVAAPAITENIATIKNRVITIASQSNAAGSVADVTLFGGAVAGNGAGAALGAHPTVTGAKYAKVEVNAIASRIEIGKVSYKNTTTNFITGFRIDGIFVNYYYPQMSLGSVASTALVNNAPSTSAESDTWYASGSTQYPAADAGKFYDYSAASGLGFDLAPVVGFSAADPAVATDKNVWAYNVLAPLAGDGTVVTGVAAPHVIIRLSDIVTKDDTTAPAYSVYPTTQYLTVKEFRKTGTTEVITSFQPGYIYYITDLTFDESNLTDIPEQEAVTAYVEAVMMKWSRQQVDWGF